MMIYLSGKLNRELMAIALAARSALDFRDVNCLRTFFPLGYFKLHFLPFVERLEAVAFYRAVVNEDVSAPFLLNKAISLGIVKPLHLSRCHFFRPPRPQCAVLACGLNHVAAPSTT
jgi:hypothetical protein